MIAKHSCVVKGGRIIHQDVVRWQKQLNALNDQECFITIAKKTKQRSLNENNYYWGCVIEISADFLGYTPEEAHEAWKWQFLRVERPGKPTTVRSTSDLSTIEFEAYLSHIREELSTMNCYCPLPNEVELSV